MTNKDIYSVFFDGACSNNGKNGKMGIGVVIYKNKKLFIDIKGYAGVGTNNEAEYISLRKALEYLYKILKDQKPKEDYSIKIYGDSMLVVKQVTGKWAVNAENLSIHHAKISFYKDKLKFTLMHILRDENQEADALSKEGLALRKKDPLEKKIIITRYE